MLKHSTARLGSIARIIMGQSPPGTTYNEAGEGLPFYQGVVDFGSRYPSHRVYCAAPTRVAEPGDILFSVRAPIGRVNIATERCSIGRGLAVVRPHDPNDRVFVEFVLRAGASHIWDMFEGGGSVFGNARRDDLESLEIVWPAVQERRTIAAILGALDDKIELNRQMNKTLEAIAQALFKSWFVDFEPFHDGGMEDSPLGPIPTGWRVISLGEILKDIISGSRPKGGAVKEGFPSIGAENVLGLGQYDYSKEKFVPEEFYKQLKIKGATVNPGDVLLYKDGAHVGRKTYFDLGFPHNECSINEHVFILRCKNPKFQRFLYLWLDQDWMTQEIVNLNSNSAQPGINKAGVCSLQILWPNEAIFETFDNLVAPIIQKLFYNCIEPPTLAATRDTLLPKLLSGEIRVKDAEKFVEEKL